MVNYNFQSLKFDKFAYLFKKALVIFKINQAIKMALNSYFYYSIDQNSPLIIQIFNKFPDNLLKAFTKSNNCLSLIFCAFFYTFILDSTHITALVLDPNLWTYNN